MTFKPGFTEDKPIYFQHKLIYVIMRTNIFQHAAHVRQWQVRKEPYPVQAALRYRQGDNNNSRNDMLLVSQGVIN